MRRARRTATSAENADSRPAQKNTAPLTASDRPNRRCSHSTTSAVITKPPPNASRLNSAARRYTVRFDGPSARRRRSADSLDRRAQVPVASSTTTPSSGVGDERARAAPTVRVDVEASRRPLGHARQRGPDRRDQRADQAVAGEQGGSLRVARPSRAAAPARWEGTR